MAYDLLLQRGNPSWMYSIDQGATTIWERWDSYTIEKGFGPADMNSFNHYAYGAVGEWMYRCMAGIDTDENDPGFSGIVLRPEPDTRSSLPDGQERIREVDAAFRSAYGTITSAWKVNADGTAEYRCTVPANSHFHGVSPANDSSNIDSCDMRASITIDRAKGTVSAVADDVEAISLYDNRGALLRSVRGSHTLDISHLGHGVYIVEVTGKTSHGHVKFVK